MQAMWRYALRSNQMIFQIIAACFVLAYFAAPATADMIVFGWMSPEGAYEFTDDIQRVPVAQLDKVQRAEVDGLENYDKYTPLDTDDEE
jgi:hypothetical protein